MHHVVSVEPLGRMHLRIRFDDGVVGEVDFRKLLPFRGLFRELWDPKYFARAFVHPDAKVVTWPNGVDVDTLLLYSKVTRRSIRSLLDNPPPIRRRRKPARRRAANV